MRPTDATSGHNLKREKGLKRGSQVDAKPSSAQLKDKSIRAQTGRDNIVVTSAIVFKNLQFFFKILFRISRELNLKILYLISPGC
jgi:hypothetical protein